MKLKLYGYGSGSRERTGKSKQYKTLRAKLDVSKSKCWAEGAEDTAGLGACLHFIVPGVTAKTSETSDNNDVALKLYDASVCEAVQFAEKIIDFAIKLRSTELLGGDFRFISRDWMAYGMEKTDIYELSIRIDQIRSKIKSLEQM